MSQSIRDVERTFKAENDLTAYHMVKLGTNDNEVDGSTAVTDNVVGVVQHDAKAGEPVVVRFGGTTKVEAGGAITKGKYVTTSADGQGATPSASSGDNFVVGTALEAASTAGDIIEVQMQNFVASF